VVSVFQHVRPFSDLTVQANLNVLTRREPWKPKFRAQLTVALFSVSAGRKPLKRSETLWNAGSALFVSMSTTPPLVIRIAELHQGHHLNHSRMTGAALFAVPEKTYSK
jgi:hypothetical protein